METGLGRSRWVVMPPVDSGVYSSAYGDGWVESYARVLEGYYSACRVVARCNLAESVGAWGGGVAGDGDVQSFPGVTESGRVGCCKQLVSGVETIDGVVGTGGGIDVGGGHVPGETFILDGSGDGERGRLLSGRQLDNRRARSAVENDGSRSRGCLDMADEKGSMGDNRGDDGLDDVQSKASVGVIDSAVAQKVGVNLPTARATADGGVSASVGVIAVGADLEWRAGAGPQNIGGQKVGANLERNRIWRQQRKQRKLRRQQALRFNDARRKENEQPALRGGVVVEKKESTGACDSVYQSLREKWQAENELATMKAKQAVELLRSKDMEIEKKAAAVRQRCSVEKGMVQIERAHAALKATDNIPRNCGGFAETIVGSASVQGFDSGGCTISPDSSTSMAEFRKCQKSLLDTQKKLEEAKVVLVRLGLDPENFGKRKDEWSVDENGDLVQEELLDQAFGDFSIAPSFDEDSNKVRIIPY